MINQLILIGFMGVGKTSVAHLIADQLSMTKIDLDHSIQTEHGDISDIMNRFGEAHFRQLEYEAFQQVLHTSSSVIATGGGILTHPPSYDLMLKQPVVIWLKASFPIVKKRIENDLETHRPLADHLLNERFESRQQLYNNCASFTIDVDDLSPQEVAEKIINRYG